MILVGQGTHTPTGFIQYWRGKSTETKPITGVGIGSVLIVYDTDPMQEFVFDGTAWCEAKKDPLIAQFIKGGTVL